MNSSLRTLSLVVASAALILGPGQAIAGDWGNDSGRSADDWGKGDDWDKGDKWNGDDYSDFRVCYDDVDDELRVKFRYRDDGWYNGHKSDYDVDRDIEVTIVDGEAICQKFPGRGHGRGLRKVENLAGLCLEERACHTDGCWYEAEFDIADEVDCRGNREFCGADIDEVLLRIDGHECLVRVSDCRSGW
jgi:hypothetical protein